MADLMKYLGDHIEEHCHNYVRYKLEIREDKHPEEFELEFNSCKHLMKLEIFRYQNLIEIAQMMEIPKKLLIQKFGYTDEEIKQDLEQSGIDSDYSY
jgi:hypothetical protein